MTFYQFAGEHPVLTVILAYIVFVGTADIVKALRKK